MTSMIDPRFALDPAIDALCDQAVAWLSMTVVVAWRLGTTVPQGIAAMLRQEQRVYTGYMPKSVRRNVRHRMYCDGLLTRPLGA